MNRISKGIFFDSLLDCLHGNFLFLKQCYQWKGMIKVLIVHCLFSRRIGPMQSVIDRATQSPSPWGFTTFTFLSSVGLKRNLHIIKNWHFSEVTICYVHILPWRLSEVTHSYICKVFSFIFLSLLFLFRDFSFPLTNYKKNNSIYGVGGTLFRFVRKLSVALFCLWQVQNDVWGLSPFSFIINSTVKTPTQTQAWKIPLVV